MKSILISLPNDVLKASDKAASSLKISRAAYIRKAIEQMNRNLEVCERAERLANASYKCPSESMRVNCEFAAIEPDPKR